MSPFKLTRTRILACGLPCALFLASCSGGTSGSAAPFSPTTLGVNQPGSTTGATISGTAKVSGSSPSGNSLRTAIGSSGLMVTVEGTQIAGTVDASGHFTLEGVPSGDVQLHFEGPGINATLTLRSVEPEETVTIVVVLSGNDAKVESDSRDGSADDDSAEDQSTDDDSADDDSADDDSADDDSADDDSTDDDSADDDSAEEDSAEDEGPETTTLSK